MKISIKDITLIAMMVAIIEVCKVALSFLPNIEVTTFWLIMFTIYFGRKIVYVVPIFIILEGAIYGVGTWWLMYLFAWPVLVFVCYIFKKNKSIWFWSIFSGTFGLFFGALCSIPYVIICAFSSGIKTGIQLGIAWWIAGIPWDIVHGVSNFAIMLALYIPIKHILTEIKVKIIEKKESSSI